MIKKKIFLLKYEFIETSPSTSFWHSRKGFAKPTNRWWQNFAFSPDTSFVFTNPYIITPQASTVNIYYPFVYQGDETALKHGFNDQLPV